jgi:DNA-binding Lrp family transcriptional regulator
MLRRDPRKTFLEISRRTRIPLENVYEIYYELKNNDVLKTVTMIDLHDNKTIDVFLIFSPEMNQYRILDYLKKSVNVNSVSITDRDFIVHSSFFNLDEYEFFLDGLENLGVKDIDDYFISEVIV